MTTNISDHGFRQFYYGEAILMDSWELAQHVLGLEDQYFQIYLT